MNIIRAGTDKEKIERHMNNKAYLSWSAGLKDFDRKPSIHKSGLQRQMLLWKEIHWHQRWTTSIVHSQKYHDNTFFETVLHLLKTNFNIFPHRSLYTKLIKISFLSRFDNTIFNSIGLFFSDRILLTVFQKRTITLPGEKFWHGKQQFQRHWGEKIKPNMFFKIQRSAFPIFSDKSIILSLKY